jgi:GT2 family glycosyltransferase
MTHTAVVILNYNGEKLLPRFLPSVVHHSQTATIIVADNGSTDRSVEILQKDFPSVTRIQLDQNYGFCGGYNRALKQIDADYYVLLNSDVEVTPGWLTPMQELLDRDQSIGAIQPKILSHSERNLFEYAGAGGGLIDSLGYPFCRGRILDTVEEDHSQYDDECEIFWATGACMMIRSRLYHQFEGLDEDFFAHMEEIDLCWKLQRNRFKVYYSGKSVVYHLGAGTLGYANPKKTYLNFRNGLSLIYKHFDRAELWYKLPIRVVLDWAASLMFLVRGDAPHAVAVVRAHKDFVKNFKQNQSKRDQLISQFPTYSRKAVYPGYVILKYFVAGRKTWSEDF